MAKPGWSKKAEESKSEAPAPEAKIEAPKEVPQVSEEKPVPEKQASELQSHPKFSKFKNQGVK